MAIGIGTSLIYGDDAQAALLQNAGIDFRFFLGVGNAEPRAYEVILPVRDDYWALPAKVRQAFRWALEQREPSGDLTYSHVFKCDRDSFIHADRLLSHYLEIRTQGLEYVGLVGSYHLRKEYGDCCGGGAGYWLSRKAIEVYLRGYDEAQLATAPYQTLEDWCVFTILDRSNPKISPVSDSRYWDLRLGPVPDESTNITWNPWKP